jgi:predicted Zn-dependent peptidase
MNIVVDELKKVVQGDISLSEIESTKQYALGRFQRSAQTVGGTAGGYSGRYFFDDVIEDFYNIPDRIKAVNKEDIVSIARAMFAEKVWGVGVLGNCGEAFARKLQRQLACLWDEQLHNDLVDNVPTASYGRTA